MLLDRQRLASVLQILGTTVGNRVLDVANFVHFAVDKSARKLFISTTDFSGYITIDFGDLKLTTLDDVPDQFLVQFKPLLAVVRASTTEDVEIIDDPKHGKIIIRTNGEYQFQKWAQAGQFPGADFSCSDEITWPVPYIQNLWSKVIIAVSKDIDKINYQGVNYDGNFAASDNRRLSVAVDTKSSCDPILIPPIFGDVIKHCRNEVVVGINRQRNTIVVACEEVGLRASVRLIDAKFGDYKFIIEGKQAGIKVVVAKSELLGAISRLMILTDVLYKVINITIFGSNQGVQLLLSIDNKNAGSETVDAVDFDLGKFDLPQNAGVTKVAGHSYHVDNLADGVSVTDSEHEVTLIFQDDGKLYVDEQNYIYLLTNIRDERPV